jgi:1A family penicillin-binding protein
MPIPQLKTKRRNPWQDYRASRGIKSSSANHRHRRKKLIAFLIPRILGLGVILGITAAIYIVIISRSLPNPNQLIEREVAQSTKIYDRTGENILYEISGDEKRTLVTLQEIPDYVEQATIAIEDKNFYKHGGFSLWAMFRTMVTNVIYRRSAGGSTLTQQFVKNAVLTPEKTISRKIKELILSYRLEKKFSKDEVLQMYLNEIPYGSNAYGVEAASQKYFGKGVKDVSLSEAAILAAIVQVPSRYSPYGPNKDILLGRKDYVLDLMSEQGYISESERDAAKSQEITFKGPETNITAPHFVMYIKGILADKYGEKMVEQEGLKIYTTLDLFKQKIAEETIAERTENYPEKYGANNAALVAIDPKTGQILAMVGSRDYFNDEIDGQVNVTDRPRQPGSSMKPIVYAALFEKGYTPDTILYDVLTNFSTNSESYQPHNYNGQEIGPVTIRKALAGSLNIPAVKAIYLADINNVIDLAENLGYSTLYPRSRFGLSLVLGGGEVKLLEHANAYSAFARDGQLSPIVSILKIEDKDGKIIEEYQPSDKKALNPQVARMINSVLSDNEARSYVFGAKNYLTLGDRPVAAKTGTTNDFHDAWAIGYTPSLVAGVWVGNSDNQAMKGKADGSVLAAPIWHDFMAKVLGDTPVEYFKAPDDYKTGKAILDGKIPISSVKIDKSSGLLATSSTPLELIEDRPAVVHHSILYYVNKDDPRGSVPNNPEKDPQFNLWERAVSDWAAKNATSSTSTLPIDYDGVHKPENKPTVSILSPLKNQTINVASLDIEVSASAPRGISRIEYYLNGNLWETKQGNPGSFSQPAPFLNNGYHTLKARACDDVENCTEETIDFNLAIKNNPVSPGKNSIKITNPGSGLAITGIDFPISISAQIGNPWRTARIDLIFKNQSDGLITNLKTIRDGIGGTITTTWDSSPGPTSGDLYFNLYDWGGSIIKSNLIKATIS